MKRCIKLIICLVLLLNLSSGMMFAQNRVDSKAASQPVWPRPIPCRIADGKNRDLFIMTLGNIETPLADGIYDPQKDEVRLKDATVKSHYYRDVLGMKYFQPIDKTRFPLPPSGWCTWYYYYQNIDETEVRRNAQWIADNLKDYGARYVQIDDGWQGNGRGSTRDWTIVARGFSGGMDSLAAFIKSVGLTPGIWLAPHGQSNEAVVKSNPNVFLLKPDGTSASETWEGKWLVDPSSDESQKYIRDLFTRLSKWGYEYFKIDGQPVVVGEYKTKKAFMKNPSDDANGLYRKTLDNIREVIGPDRYLLGCWGIPVEGMGIMNGSRTGGDIVLGWDGFRTALRATMQHFYQHNIAWYVDPDVLVVRSPLTVDQARVWATLQGLTGQGLMSTDRLMDLSEERVELLRRVYPAVDVRPLDLFPTNQNKRIWDLKVNHLDRQYDIVGLFNFDDAKAEPINLNWKELGIADAGPVHVFDFWNQEYLGAWEGGMKVDLSPTSCRVLTLLPATDRIQLISTNRHITQGWVDLISYSSNLAGDSFTGKSKVIKNDPYEVRFVFPPGKNFAVKKATARSSSGNLPVKISNHQGWATVRILSPKTTEVSWDVVFEPADYYHYPVREPANLSVERVGLEGANLRWSAQYYLNSGYQVYLDGNLLGYTQTNSYPLLKLDPNHDYTAEVKTIWEDGKTSEKKAEVKFNLKSTLPDEMALSELEPLRSAMGLRINRAFSGGPLALGGKRYAGGLGARAGSEIEYDLKGLFDSFSAMVGLDDGNVGVAASVEFIILADGKELWRSGAMKKGDGPKPVKVSVAGAQRLVLRVVTAGGGANAGGPGGGNRNNRDSADWAEARVTR